MDEQWRLLDQLTVAGIDMAVRFGPRVLVAVLILTAGHFAGRWTAQWLVRGLAKFGLERPVLGLAARIFYLIVLGLFLIMALQNLGVELLPLIAGLSIVGAGIALAMQGVLGNLVAGLTIIFARPFRVGDYISIVQEEGEVMDIRLFNTTLGHPDRSRVVIPNRKIVGEILHNYGRIRQLQVEVGVSYDTDVGAAVALIEEVLTANARVLRDPRPIVRVARLDASGIAISVAPWVQVPDYWSVTGEVYEAILRTFRARNIVIPFPQRDIRIVSSAAYLSGQRAEEGLAGRNAA